MPAARSARSEGSPAPFLYYDEPGRVAFYGWRDVDFVLWMCTPAARTIHAVGEVIPRRMQAHANRLSVLHVIYPGCGVPDPEARVEYRKIGARWRDEIACIGLVVEGGGLWMSAWPEGQQDARARRAPHRPPRRARGPARRLISLR